MASEVQYQFFKSLYEEESERYSNLEARVRLYLSILIFYLGAIAVSGKDVLVLTAKTAVGRDAFAGAGILFMCALACCLFAASIRQYEGLTDPRQLVGELNDSPPTDDEFFDARIVDFTVATERNSLQNDRTATALTAALVFAFLGAAFHMIGFMTFLFKGA